MKRKPSVVRRAWQRLTEPSPRLTDPELRGRSRLLSVLLLLFIAVSLVVAAYVGTRVSPGPAQTNPELLMILGIAAGATVAYLLNRRGAYLPAALLAVGLLAGGTFATTHFILSGALTPTYRTDDVSLLAYLVLSLIFVAIMFPVWLAAVAGGCIIAGMFLVPVVHPHVSYSSIVFGPLLVLLMVGVCIVLIARYWQGVGRGRRAALTESGKRYRSLFEESLDPVLLIAADGTITAVNAAGSALFGYPRAELEGRHVRDLYADPARRVEVVRKAERQGQLYEEPVRLKKRDGSVLDCLVTIQLRRNGGGDVLEYQTIVRDATGRLRAEEDLRLRGELIALAHDSVYLGDPAGEIVFANEAFVRLTGYGADELVGMNMRRLNTPEGAEQVPSKIGRVLREGELEFETVYVRKDGTQVDVEVRARAIKTGGRTLLLSVGRDVTQRKSDEAELRMRGELLDSVYDSVFLHDLRGSFLYVNEAAAAALGYTREELLSLKVQQMSAPEHSVLFRRRIDVLLRKGSMTFESEYLRKDGSALPMEVRATLFESAEKTLVLCVARDVSERKRYEESLRRTQFSVDNAAMRVFWITPEGEFVYVNETAARELGYSRAELVGMHVWDLDPDYDEASRPAQWQRIKELGSIIFETYHRGRDGRPVPVRVTSNYLEFHGMEMSVSFAGDISEERRAREALAESEEKYRSLFEQSMDAIHVTAFDGAYVEANQAWLDLFGYSRDEASRLNAADFYADSEDREDFLRRIAETGLVEDEVRLKKKDGTVMDCLRSVVAQMDDHGNVVAYQGVIHDITNRKRAQQALEASEEKYRSLFEQSMDAVAVVALDGTLLDANPAYLKMYGYDVADIGCANVRGQYLRAADRNKYVRRMERSGAIRDEEVRLKKVDGTVMDCLLTSNAMRDASGHVVSFQTVVRDITEQKMAGEVLRESETRFRELSELLPQAICETDIGGNITFANRKALEIWGYSGESLELGVNISEVIAPEDRGRAGAGFEALLRGGGAASGEYLALRRDGTVFPVDICSDLMVRGGDVVGIRAVLVDISDRKKAEQQLRDLAAHVEEVREDERTGIARELHDRLAQALTALRLDVADMKGRVEKGETIMPEKFAGTMGLIDETADDVRRISSELRPGMLDDLGLVAAMEWQLGQFRERTGLECRLDSPGDDSDLGRSRSTALFRIFQELLTNVARHAGASRVSVSFELDDGRYVLAVADDGRGMTEEEMTALGSLGLIGIRERVRPFGGRIEIEGVPDGGTTVRVYVPAG